MRMRHYSITILSTEKPHSHDYKAEQDSTNGPFNRKASRIMSSDRDTVRSMTTCQWETCSTHLSSGNDNSSSSMSDDGPKHPTEDGRISFQKRKSPESVEHNQAAKVNVSGLSTALSQCPTDTSSSPPLPINTNGSFFSGKSDTWHGISLNSSNRQQSDIGTGKKRHSAPNSSNFGTICNDRFLDADESFPIIPKRLLRRTKTPAVRRANKMGLGGGFNQRGIKSFQPNEMKKTEDPSSTNSFLGDGNAAEYTVSSGGRFSGGQCPPINYGRIKGVICNDVVENNNPRLHKGSCCAIFSDGDDHNLDLDLPDYTFRRAESEPVEKKAGKKRFHSLPMLNKLKSHKMLILHICGRIRSPLDSWKRK